jgi:hypothetical protein
VTLKVKFVISYGLDFTNMLMLFGFCSFEKVLFTHLVSNEFGSSMYVVNVTFV